MKSRRTCPGPCSLRYMCRELSKDAKAKQNCSKRGSDSNMLKL
ncbi:MAG: hypothetical protein ACJ0BU_08225 [Candidatus Puniceispirillales bacterium]